MHVFVAENAGFCFGVKRALETAVQNVSKKHPVYTLGPLIHNPQEVERLKELGIKSVDILEDVSNGTVIFRSHGVGKAVFERASEMGLDVVDATCPFVKRVQQKAADFLENGFQPIIIGDKEHPEVEGILGWTDGKAIVIESPEEAKKLAEYQKLGVVVQTTQTEENFNAIVEILKIKTKNLKVVNTICNATQNRQARAAEMARRFEIILVVGGKNSANTLKLASICRSAGARTYQIEEAGEIDAGWFEGIERVGITAGASTPDWIIKEVISKMSEINSQEIVQEELVQEEIETMPQEETMAEGLASFEKSLVDLSNGANVKGVVVQVSDDEVLVDIGGKSEGILPKRELSFSEAEDIRAHFKPGDEVEVVVIRAEDEEGRPVLSKRRIDQDKTWEKIEAAKESGEIITGKVTGAVKGGLTVDVGLRGFIPASLVDTRFIEDLTPFVNQVFKLKVLEYDRFKNKLILSRKAILIEEQAVNKQKLLLELEVGQVRKGIVKRIADFGAFVDIGGIDGLLHVSEMAWQRIKHPSEVVKEGDVIEVYVLSFDKDTLKVSLSLRKILDNPWDKAEEKYPIGSVVNVKVLRLAAFGAFVEIEPGLEGLIHISQLSDKRIAKTQDAVSVGKQVEAKILNIDKENKKISLSIRELLEDAGKVVEIATEEVKPDEETGTIQE